MACMVVGVAALTVWKVLGFFWRPFGSLFMARGDSSEQTPGLIDSE